MNVLNSFDKTDREYSLAPTDDLISVWRSKVKVTAGRRGSKASTSMLGHESLFLVAPCVLFVICQNVILLFQDHPTQKLHCIWHVMQ